ncbi:hypothetical protein ACQP1O_42790 (plasmid) [Nocardia sp. CA-151230]|uniref:hypothetical protein n=1 Tax=Nocardia sp. CA-151230 TaxID=3239982 RepID=UPI003D8B1257
MSTNFALIGLTAALVTVTACLYLLPLRDSRSAARHRLKPDSPDDATKWLDASSHDAPRIALSPIEAHATMQTHRECRTADCARKAAAFDTLTGTGAIKPRTR